MSLARARAIEGIVSSFITLFRSKQYYVELTIFYGIFHHLGWMWRIFCEILSVLHNIVLVMNNEECLKTHRKPLYTLEVFCSKPNWHMSCLMRSSWNELATNLGGACFYCTILSRCCGYKKSEGRRRRRRLLALIRSHTITWAILDDYTNHPNHNMLLFGFMQCSNVLLKSSIFSNKSSIGCLNIIEHG